MMTNAEPIPTTILKRKTVAYVRQSTQSQVVNPLHDDGMGLAEKMKAAGVSVELKEYSEVTHEFFGMGAVVADAQAALDFAAGRLKAEFLR